jgi:hypothetical protein
MLLSVQGEQEQCHERGNAHVRERVNGASRLDAFYCGACVCARGECSLSVLGRIQQWDNGSVEVEGQQPQLSVSPGDDG